LTNIVIDDVGGNSYTFVNAYQAIDEDGWNLLGFSVAIKGSGNQGMMNLYIYSEEGGFSEDFYEMTEGMNFNAW